MPAYEYNEYDSGRIPAQYTIVLKTLLDNGYDLGLDKYPIFDENYRVTLNTKIINHYLTREIAWETAGLFKFHLNSVMAEIMPLYNQYYEAGLLEIDPITNYKSTENYDRTRGDTTHRHDTADSSAKNNTTREDEQTSNRDSNGTSTVDNLQVHSATPQTNITRQDLDNGLYADDTQQNDGNENTTLTESNTQNTNITENNTGEAESSLDSNINANTTENYIKTISGYNGISPQYLLQQLYETFQNTDLDIINHPSIQEQFFGLLS